MARFRSAGPGITLARLLHRFWQARGFDAEAHRWLTAFIELAERTGGGGSRTPSTTTGARNTITSADHAAAVALLGMFASRRGDHVGARRRLTEAATIWRAIGNETSLAVTLAILGLTEWMAGDLAAAVEHLEESRHILRRCEADPLAVGYAPVTLRHLGVITRHQGEYERAAEYFRESLIQARRSAVPSLTGYNITRALSHLGRTVYLQGDSAQAKQFFGEALNLMRAGRLAGHHLAECLDWLAAVADAGGRSRDAAVLFGAAEAQWQTSGGVRYAPEQPRYEAELAAVRSKLSSEEFAAAWAEGRAMGREQAVDFGLEQVRGSMD